MKFLLYAFLFSAGSVLPLLAASDSRIVTSDGRTIPASQVKLRSNGDLEYLSEDGKIKNRIAKGHYRYARIPKPASVTEADLKFKEQQWKSAAALYHKAAAEYKLLGWQTYCLRMEAECLVRSGEKKQAAALLRELHAGNEPDPGLLREKALADNLLAELLIDNKEYAEAGKILEKQQRMIRIWCLPLISKPPSSCRRRENGRKRHGVFIRQHCCSRKIRAVRKFCIVPGIC